MPDNDNILEKPNSLRLFWAVSVLILLWNLFGCAAYLTDVTISDAKYGEMYGEGLLSVRHKFPAWSIAAYALAVWGGLIASICMLLRRKTAGPIFIVSLIAAIISFIWIMTNPEGKAAAGPSFWVMPVIVTIAGLFEIWWSRRKTADGTLS